MRNHPSRWKTSASGCVTTLAVEPTTCTASTETWPRLEPSLSAVSLTNTLTFILHTLTQRSFPPSVMPLPCVHKVNRTLSPFLGCQTCHWKWIQGATCDPAARAMLLCFYSIVNVMYLICASDRDMGARHRARAHAIQIMKVQIIPANKCRRPAIKQFHVSLHVQMSLSNAH